MPQNALDNYVLWLLPDEAGSDYFTNIISVLAAKYQTVTFLPHITVGRVPEIGISEIENNLTKIGQNTPEFVAKVKKVWCREKWAEKISVEIETNSQFENVLSSIDLVFKGPFAKREYPHLSLLYGDIPCSELRVEVENLNHIILNRFKITSIALMDLHGEPNEWRVVSRADFAL